MFGMTKLTETCDISEKVRIQEILAQNNIEYRIKTQDLYARNPVDTARIGMLGMGGAFGRAGIKEPKYEYTFLVKKENVDEAMYLIRGR